MLAKPGQMLSHYRLVEKIGEGGMGEVWRSQDTHLGDRDVAVKVLRAGLVADDSARTRFRREALALSELNHPAIATVFDFDTQDGTDFLVMEYVPGVSLDERLAEGALGEAEIVALSTQLAEGLATAHAQGIVHRDLKPANLRLKPDGRLKILDFGLVKLLRPAEEADATEPLTQTRGIVGTFPYLAPEQLKGGRIDARTDVYAAGTILYEMATGRRPFQETSTAQLLYAIAHEAPDSPRSHSGEISTGLESVILKALEKDPRRRYQNATELEEELRRLGAGMPVAAPRPVGRRAWRWAIGLVGVAALVLAGLVVLDVGGLRGRLTGAATSGPRIASLAVLPLENLSGDPEQEYFSDGMTEALITNLSKIGSLKVISRTSTMRYKGPDRPPLPDIARELGVDAVVEGSVLRAGDRVRITTQLIDAATDQHLWADSFDRDLHDILSLQSEVSRAIAEQIRLELTAQEEERLATDRRVNPEAYEAYLMGEYYLHRFPAPETSRCIESFQQAIEKEPNWADAYAGLADCYASMPWHFPPKDVFPQAKAAAERALELDPNHGEAYAALGRVNANFEWDWAAAETNLSRALELSPSVAHIHGAYGLHLTIIGRFEDGIRERKIALELNPVSAQGHRNLGYVYLLSRRYGDYAGQARTTLEMAPEHPWARFDLAWAYALQGMREEALAELEKGVPAWGRALVLATLGEHERALLLTDQVEQDWGVGSVEFKYTVDPFVIAFIYAALGETDEALRWLENAYEYRSAMMNQLKVHPGLDPVRDDPRFQDLLRRMNFPD